MFVYVPYIMAYTVINTIQYNTIWQLSQKFQNYFGSFMIFRKFYNNGFTIVMAEINAIKKTRSSIITQLNKK